MKYAILSENTVMKVLDVDWTGEELHGRRCDGVDVHALDSYEDGAFYRGGVKLMSDEQSAQQLLDTWRAEAQNVSDEVAAAFPSLFPEWQPLVAYAGGYKVLHNGTLYRCLQYHTSQEDWMPSVATSLWAKILPGQDDTEIGEWEQPNSTNAYKKGDKVKFEGKTYESLIDNNVWSPSAYPAGWKEI